MMATVSTPVRQPFGILNESKLRNLQSIKNRQNAITPNSAPALKRRAPSPELSDSENIDPSIFDSAIKRKRAAFDDDVSASKQQRIFTTKVVPAKTYIPPTTSTTSFTPSRLDTVSQSISAPLSAPPAAGRSPTRLSSKPHTFKAQPRRRFLPPSLGTTSPSLSISAALRGTLASKKSRPSIRKSKSLTLGDNQPKSWQFQIFEETEETQDYRMNEWTMTQSSAALDISDDEGKLSFSGKQKVDDKGKENIDPNAMLEVSAPMTRSQARAAEAEAAIIAEEKKDEMDLKEPRTPLGDLNASDYYAEGLDATSVVVVQDDVPVEEATPIVVEHQEDNTAAEPAPEAPVIEAPAVEDFTFTSSLQPASLEASPVPEDIPEWARKTTLTFDTESYYQQHKDIEPAMMPLPGGDDNLDIEIWESESAKDENEQYDCEQEQSSNIIIVPEGGIISLSSSCALQEL